ncbi:hypothetical protein AGMMS50256_24900 [Betaproteobacteria bacterium]|nr:hypothetical protein AGMMS50256_24900 [Betaproteobacteria bacterium]
MREKASGQRSSPFNVLLVPSVMESPNAAMTRVEAGANMSSASRKYQDVLLYGKFVSLLSAPTVPAFGAEI